MSLTDANKNIRLLQLHTDKQTDFFLNGQKTWIDIFPKRTCRKSTNVWKDAQCHHHQRNVIQNHSWYYVTLCRQILYQLSQQGSPRILEWVAYPFSRRSSWPRNWTRVSYIAGRLFTSWATREETDMSKQLSSERTQIANVGEGVWWKGNPHTQW